MDVDSGLCRKISMEGKGKALSRMRLVDLLLYRMKIIAKI